MADESVIKLSEDKKIRIVWNEEQEKYYFSVVDIVQVLTDSADAKQYIKRMRSRDPELDSVWGTNCTPHQSTGEYKRFKGLTKENLRDNMTNIELDVRERFAAVSAAVSERRKDLSKISTDQIAFKAQKDTPGGCRTMPSTSGKWKEIFMTPRIRVDEHHSNHRLRYEMA